MLRVTLFQMRQNIGRLIAAGIAILIGTAFIAATFMGGQVFVQTSQNSMTAEYANADLVATGVKTVIENGYENTYYNGVSEAQANKIKDLPEVTGIVVNNGGFFALTTGARQEYLPFVTVSDQPNLTTLEYEQGKAPATANEIAVPVKIGTRFDVAVGQTLKVTVDDGENQAVKEFTVSGLTNDPHGSYSKYGGAALTTFDGLANLSRALDKTASFNADSLLVAIDPAIHPGTPTFDQVQEHISAITDGAKVSTLEQLTADSLKAVTGDSNIIMTAVLAFAAVALLVAALVISNTFQVLVAQRARTLALLRCVGANTKQIKRSVLVEALILGVIASAGGIVVGILLVEVILWGVGLANISAAVPTSVGVPLTAIWVPLLAGTVVTVLASLVPARVATRVAPLAALRPIEGVAETRGRAGKIRTVFSALLVFGGVALMVLGFVQRDSSITTAVIAGLLGGASSFVGLIISAVLWVPSVVAGFGLLFKRFGAPARLASANIARNPRRTASTATALFIGVTLVSLLSIGASTATATMNKELDKTFPIDLQAQFYGNPDDEASNQDAISQIRSLPGVAAVATSRWVIGQYATELNMTDEWTNSTGFYEISSDVNSVLRNPSAFAALAPGKVLTSGMYPPLKEGEKVQLFYSGTNEVEGSAEKQPGWNTRMEFAVGGTNNMGGFLLETADFDKFLANAQVDPKSVTTGYAFIKIADDANVSDTVDAVRDILSNTNSSLDGAAMQRQMFQDVINVMLLVLVGLLGVAVLIALIGVANTLSLSIIERRRENATLRAVGMSRRQLRFSLAYEGMLIAGIGAFVGVLLGGIYAWVGASLLLSELTSVQFAVRWTDIVIIFVIALGAGLLASVLPARSAVRTSPVEALAVD